MLDAKLAAILMGGFAALSYFTARLLLTVPWSIVVALVSAFGTQVFSTASRSIVGHLGNLPSASPRFSCSARLSAGTD